MDESNTIPTEGGSPSPIAHAQAASGESATSGGYLLMSGHAAANGSPRRGMLYYPTQNPRMELSPIAAEEIRRRVHWLCANFGFARRLVKMMSKAIGTLTPAPRSGSDEWDEMAFENFETRAGSADIYDRGGRVDFSTGQLLNQQLRFRDGYAAGIGTETASGGAQMAFYEAASIRTPQGQEGNSRFIDGARLDRWGRHTCYGFCDPENTDRVTTVNARDVFYFGCHESHQQIHPASILAHAVLGMTDVVELRGDWKSSIKSTADKGHVIERDPMYRLSQNASGFGGNNGPITVEDYQVPDGKGGFRTEQINFQQVMNGTQVPVMKPGERLRVVADGRPSKENQQFEEALLRDCALGCDLPFEIVYNIAGLTGPGVRFVMAELERWILNQQIQAAKWAQRYWGFHIAKEIRAGRLPDPGVAYWRLVDWIGQPSMTIDAGRATQGSIIQLDHGLTTWADQWGAQGFHWKRKINQRIRELAWAHTRIAEAAVEFNAPQLTFANVFPGMVQREPLGVAA